MSLNMAEKQSPARALVPRLVDQYYPHIPHPTQQWFLCMSEYEEVLFGGAAGGGKSDALLMAALQYVDVPGYSALLLRRTWPDLSLPGAIMDRANQWLRGTDAVAKDGGRQWVFPSGAKLTFGYLQHDQDKYRYQSAEFQFIGFDELTQFQQTTYEYMFSRLRRPQIACANCRRPVKKYDGRWKHTNSRWKSCDSPWPDYKVLMQYPETPDGKSIFNIPLRMRSATNPGGIGHVWVRERFIDPRTRKNPYAFVPSLLEDNPALDQESYQRNLQHLNVIDRQRLLEGNWDVSEEGNMFARHWFNTVDDTPLDAKAIRYWDLAATKPAKGKDPDYTVGALLKLSDDGRWWIDDIVRGQFSPLETERLILQTAIQDGRYVPVRIEQEPGSSGVSVIDHYRRNVLVGFDFDGDRPTGPKELRAKPLSAAAEAGNVNMKIAGWNRDWLDESSLFPNGAHDDQVDAVSGAMTLLANMKRSRIIV